MRRSALPLVVLALGTGGCVASPRPRPNAAPAAARTSVLRDGRTGTEVGVVTLHGLIEVNDVIAFGELHDHPEGARLEREILGRLSRSGPGRVRPATLAMEFFERDTQADLDAYLAGTLAEEEFVKRTRQGPGYAKAHRHLIERAKAAQRPVIAANAPRRLVTVYRKQEAPYTEWKSTLPEADRAALPRETSVIDDVYRARFVELMGAERGARLFKAQSLWDDAIAEAVADRRAAHPDERVLLVVGAFHVQGRLGTLTKYVERRPGDRVGLIVMAYGEGLDLALPADMRGQADLVLLVPKPPEPPAAPKAPTPKAATPTAPTPKVATP